MSYSRLSNKFIVFMSLILISVCSYAQDAVKTESVTTSTVHTSDGPVVVNKRTIITTTPAPKEAYTTPTGYLGCAMAPATWVGDKWIAERKVCTYADSPSGLAWVDGYWSCEEYQETNNACTNWLWNAAHWVNTYPIY